MKVSVLIVTFNGRRWIAACLDSVAVQTHSDIEILALDNGSTDGTAAFLADVATRNGAFSVVLESTNLGFAGGQNRLIEGATGELVCLLNQDVVLDEQFISEAVAAFARSPTIGAVQARVYRLSPELERSRTIDTTGLEMHRSRRVVSRGQGTDDDHQFDEPGEVFGADGPCPVFRRIALEDVAIAMDDGKEYLDGDFFAYKEDVDLAWRLRLAGWNAQYVPSAIAWHGRSAAEPANGGIRAYVRHRRSMAPWLRRMSWRNHRLMQLKNEDPRLFIRDIGPIAWRELRSLAFMAVVHPSDLVAIIDVVRLAPRMLRKRHSIQRRRRISQARFSEWLHS